MAFRPLAVVIALALAALSGSGAAQDASGPPTPAARLAPPAAEPAPAGVVETDPAGGGNASPGTVEAARETASESGEAAGVEAALLFPSQLTDADLIVERVILPAAERLTAAAIALQNAVIRHCLGPARRPTDDVEQVFADAVVAAAATEPHAFGAEANRIVPALIFTEVANTAFSRSRLEAIMNARISPPTSLADLAAEEPGITGLSALEQLLLLPPYNETATKANRCRLAIPIAAKIRMIANVVEERWRRRAVDAQWTADEPELADRLRLRDLIQAMIDVSDRLDRDVSQFAPNPLGNERLPFVNKRRMEMYLDTLSRALLREADVVSRFAPADSAAQDSLARVVAALQQGRELLFASDAEREAAAQLFDRAQQEIAQLPSAFNFAPAAFQRPLASFEPSQPQAPEPQATGTTP